MTDTTVPAGVQVELDRIANPHTRQVLAYLVGRAGIRGTAGLLYLAQRMRYHLGDRKAVPVAKSLNTVETAHVERRAGELLDEHRHLLPALTIEVAGVSATPGLPAGAGIPTEPAPLPANVVPIAAARQRPLGHRPRRIGRMTAPPANDVRVLRTDADRARLALEAAGVNIIGAIPTPIPTPSDTMVTIVTTGRARTELEDLLEADGIDAYSIVTIQP